MHARIHAVRCKGDFLSHIPSKAEASPKAQQFAGSENPRCPAHLPQNPSHQTRPRSPRPQTNHSDAVATINHKQTAIPERPPPFYSKGNTHKNPRVAHQSQVSALWYRHLQISPPSPPQPLPKGHEAAKKRLSSITREVLLFAILMNLFLRALYSSTSDGLRICETSPNQSWPSKNPRNLESLPPRNLETSIPHHSLANATGSRPVPFPRLPHLT